MFALCQRPNRLFQSLSFAMGVVLLSLCFNTQSFAAVTQSATNNLKLDQDSDKDGLPDFQEKHKYLTDPNKIDSDGDGIADGVGNERREFQYTIRSVVQVMKPVTIAFLNDDYQDAKILDETDDYVELEVIHYPFNTVASAIKGNDNWRDDASKMEPWTRPGPSADWTPEMQKELKAALKKDGIDVGQLDDKQVAEKVSSWLCKRANYEDGFTGFVTAWNDEGKPYIPDGLEGSIQRELSRKGRDSVEEQWEHEVSAKGMFKHKTRGSCTSSAIYLNGCLKAVGLPTRTILCIPIIDASDEREFEMINNLEQRGVRQHLIAALKGLKQSWASHTFNEVYIGGRWRRLNYDRLGQNTYDRQLFGLITHVATFNDWSDAQMHKTVGRRQKTDGPKDVFGFRNPYSTISLRDEVGKHCKIELPEEIEEGRLIVERIFWTDADELDAGIRESCIAKKRFGFIAEVSGVTDMEQLKEFLDNADLRVFMKPVMDEHPRLGIAFTKNCFWLKGDRALIYVPFGAGDKADLSKGTHYRFEPRDSSKDRGFGLRKELTISRGKDVW